MMSALAMFLSGAIAHAETTTRPEFSVTRRRHVFGQEVLPDVDCLQKRPLMASPVRIPRNRAVVVCAVLTDLYSNELPELLMEISFLTDNMTWQTLNRVTLSSHGYGIQQGQGWLLASAVTYEQLRSYAVQSESSPLLPRLPCQGQLRARIIDNVDEEHGIFFREYSINIPYCSDDGWAATKGGA